MEKRKFKINILDIVIFVVILCSVAILVFRDTVNEIFTKPEITTLEIAVFVNGEENCSAVSALLDKNAVFVPDNKNDFTVKADTEGFITHAEEGEGGFGYDPLFFCEKFGKTFASLTPDEKNSLSHRGRAIKLFAEKFAEIMTEKYN